MLNQKDRVQETEKKNMANVTLFVELSCLICIKFLLLLATRNVRVQVKIVANATLSLAPYSSWAVGICSVLELHNYILVN